LPKISTTCELVAQEGVPLDPYPDLLVTFCKRLSIFKNVPKHEPQNIELRISNTEMEKTGEARQGAVLR
jgi:hypothetical protein